jgi:hypothetical protein
LIVFEKCYCAMVRRNTGDNLFLESRMSPFASSEKLSSQGRRCAGSESAMHSIAGARRRQRRAGEASQKTLRGKVLPKGELCYDLA